MKVFFWQNMPSHIQTGALERFASMWPDAVTGVWCSPISAQRKALGWGSDRRQHLSDMYLPSEGWDSVVGRIVDLNDDAIHILSGIGAYAPVTLAAKLLAKRHAPKLGLIVEPAVALGWRKWLRPLKARWVYRAYVNKVAAVLAIGEQGRRFYLNAGFQPHQIFPYLYQCPFDRIQTSGDTSSTVRFVYVGQFTHRKGTDELVAAVALLRGHDWSLTLFGAGPLEPKLRRMVRVERLDDQVHFGGVLAAPIVVQTLAQHDVCCIPSRFDGWGVVTNEAFHAGLPSVVSSRASSADLVRFSGVGRIYTSGDVKALANCINEYLVNPELMRAEKERAAAYCARITPDVVGEYLYHLLSHVFLKTSSRPVAPWVSAPAS